jgi:hypothetical protein
LLQEKTPNKKYSQDSTFSSLAKDRISQWTGKIPLQGELAWCTGALTSSYDVGNTHTHTRKQEKMLRNTKELKQKSRKLARSQQQKLQKQSRTSTNTKLLTATPTPTLQHNY